LREVIESKGCNEAFIHVENLAGIGTGGGGGGGGDGDGGAMVGSGGGGGGNLSASMGRLWRQLAESSLLALELGVADKALVRCGDYTGIQLVKKLSSLGQSKEEEFVLG
jgi:hypothetical protein